jgi:hypothetical protein
MLRALKTRVRWCTNGETGFAVPTVMLAMIAAFGLGTATIVASVGAQQGTTRDENSKAALAAAEAGVANAMLRYNRVRTDAGSTADDCVPVGGTSVAADGWCAAEVTGPIDQGGYAYRVRPTAAAGSTPAQLTVVSTGTVDGVSRRVTTTAESIASGFRPFAEASVIGLDSIYLDSDATIDANVATNGDIGLSANSSLLCDYSQVGVGHGYGPVGANVTTTCPPTSGSLSLPPVNPGDVLTNNSNDRICNLDPITGTSCAAAWNPNTMKLTLGSNDSITMGAAGGEFNYAFCQIDLGSNSYLHIANGAIVRIYFLSPDSAPCLDQGEPLRLDSNSKIEPTGSDPTGLQLLVVGSATKPTHINLDSNSFLFGCDQAFVLYAPRTTVNLRSNTAICGGVAAKSVYVNANTTILASGSSDEFELPGEEVPPHYDQPGDFAECQTTQAVALPDEGC